MELLALVLLTIVAATFLLGPLVLGVIQTERSRRQIARETMLADLRLRQVAQAGFLALVAETRRARDGNEHG